MGGRYWSRIEPPAALLQGGGSRNQARLLKNNFSFGVRRVSDYGGAQEGVHDDGSAISEGIAVLLLPSRGSDSRDSPAQADRSLRRFQFCAGPVERCL